MWYLVWLLKESQVQRIFSCFSELWLFRASLQRFMPMRNPDLTGLRVGNGVPAMRWWQ
jgi:hypothetical protein